MGLRELALRVCVSGTLGLAGLVGCTGPVTKTVGIYIDQNGRQVYCDEGIGDKNSPNYNLASYNNGTFGVIKGITKDGRLIVEKKPYPKGGEEFYRLRYFDEEGRFIQYGKDGKKHQLFPSAEESVIGSTIDRYGNFLYVDEKGNCYCVIEPGKVDEWAKKGAERGGELYKKAVSDEERRGWCKKVWGWTKDGKPFTREDDPSVLISLPNPSYNEMRGKIIDHGLEVGLEFRRQTMDDIIKDFLQLFFESII